MVANDADEAKLNVSYGGGATLPRNQSSTLLKIKSVPIVEIAPIERRYILGVSACKLFYQRFRRSDQPAKCIVLLIHGYRAGNVTATGNVNACLQVWRACRTVLPRDQSTLSCSQIGSTFP